MKWLVVACALAVVSCHRGEAGELADGADRIPADEVWLSPAQMTKANIHVAEASEQRLARPLRASGRIAFDDLRVAHVFSPVTGRVTAVLAKPGERLAKGAPLVSILSPDVGAAFSDVLKAQADLEATEADFHREATLLAEDATSKRSYDTAEDAYRRASAEAARARQRAALLRGGAVDAVTQQYTLRTALAGEVIARTINPGAEVVGQYAGGAAQELFTIGDIKRVWVYADVPDTELGKVKLGDDVAVSVPAYPGRVFHGAVDLVADTVDPAARTGRVRATLVNEDEALKPEMAASVAIAQPPELRLAVPHGAVVQVNEASYVYVAGPPRPDGRLAFKRHPVRIGEDRDGLTPILDGVAPGERVVVEGSVSTEQPNDEVWPSPVQLANGQITTAAATVQDVPGVITVGGRLTFDDSKIAHVFSPVSGRITKLLAQPGQRVAAGAPLVALVSQDVGTYLADLVKAEADRAQADHEVERQRELVANHIGAPRDLEAAIDAQRRAGAEYARAKQLSQLVRSADFDSVSQEYVLRSPIAGEVIARKATVGFEVQGQYSNGGNNAVELFTIGEVAQLWVLGDVYEMDLPQVTEGDAVTVRVAAYPDKLFTGHVDWVADVLDPATHTAKVRCVIDNPDHLLRAEQYESVDIAVPGTHVLAVPRDAVMRVDGQTIVFVKTGEVRPDGGVVFKRRPIVAKLGSSSPLVAVSAGLAPGEVVAVKHSLMLLGML